MSYAVIQTGGKQYKVKSGEILKVEKLSDTKSDAKIEFKEIIYKGFINFLCNSCNSSLNKYCKSLICCALDEVA